MADIPVPPPGPMAEQRHRWGGVARGDAATATPRSRSGRRIRVRFHGSGTARSRVLVAGCIAGRRCAGQQVPVAYECPPTDAELWWMPTLRPEGADLDRAPREPGAAALRQAVADLRPRTTVLYRTGPAAVVRAAGTGQAAARRYARLTGIPFRPADPGGLAGWIQAVRPGAAAITVELPAGRMPHLEAQRHGYAIQRLALTRSAYPVREARTPGGTVSVLHGGFAKVSRRRGAGLTLTEGVMRPARLPCDPADTRRRLGRYGSLIRIEDRGVIWPGTAYPPRSRPLRPGLHVRHPCLGPARVVRFSDTGRNVEVTVALGRDANRWTRRGARRVLDAIAVVR